MSSQLPPSSQSESVQPSLFSIPQSSSASQSDSPQSATAKMLRYWTRKTVPIAIALGLLPVLGLGGLTFGVGRQMVREAAPSQVEAVRGSARFWLALLLLGAGVTAILTGGLAWLWLKVFVNALVKQSTQLATQSDQSQVSASLQNWGYIVGLLQEQESTEAILDTAAVEVRSLFRADRAVIFCDGVNGSAMHAEDQVAGQESLLQTDRSQLSMPLDQLFSVPVGYVLVCSEVNGSHLPQSHQDDLTALGVQSQMVTQMTLGNQSQGILVVQGSTPRDWTAVEHQLFAAIAKQIALAIDCKTRLTRPNTTSGLDNLWSNYHHHCLNLAKSSHDQAHRLTQVMDRIQTGLSQNQMLKQSLQQVQAHIQNHSHVIQTSEAAVDRSMASITQMQETLAQSQHSSEQLIDLSQKVSQTSAKIKDLASRVNHQVMNASISAKKQRSTDQSWTVDFTNEVLQLTRELSHQTNEIEKLSSQVLAEGNTLSTSADTGSEQLLVSAEWFRESRQQWTQMVAVNGQLDASLRRLMEHHQEREQNATLSYQQVLELSHWLNQTIDESDAMVQSMEHLTSRALA